MLSSGVRAVGCVGAAEMRKRACRLEALHPARLRTAPPLRLAEGTCGSQGELCVTGAVVPVIPLKTTQVPASGTCTTDTWAVSVLVESQFGRIGMALK